MQFFLLSIQHPPTRLFGSLVTTSLSFPSWQLAVLSFVFLLGADNSRSDLSWTAFKKKKKKVEASVCFYTGERVCFAAKDEGP